MKKLGVMLVGFDVIKYLVKAGTEFLLDLLFPKPENGPALLL